MSQPLPHPSGNEYTDQVQENLIAYFRLFEGLPGVTFVEEDIVFVASQGLPGSQVLRTRVPDEVVEQRLDEALSQIGQSSDGVDWFVFPSCRPDDLGQRLVTHGEAGGPNGAWRLFGKIGGPGGTWMVADLASLANHASVPANFHIKQARDLTQLKAWEKINAKGFGSDNYQIFYDAFARHGFGPEANALHFIGYLGDEPVTSATLFLAGGIASVFNVSTPEALRRQGFGSAITYAALQEAPKRGYQTAYIWSSPLGRGVYGKLGFAITDFGVREYQWQKR